MNGWRLVAVVSLVLVVSAALGLFVLEDDALIESDRSVRDHEHARRLERVGFARPELGRPDAIEVLEASDRATAGRTRDDIYALVAEQQPTEAQITAYFEDHRDLFGRRSFEASRESVQRMLALEMALEALGVRAQQPRR